MLFFRFFTENSQIELRLNSTQWWTPTCHSAVTNVKYNTCCLCSSLERKAPDMKRLSRPVRSSLRRDVSRGRRASREASVILLPGRAKLSNLEPRHRPTWQGTDTQTWRPNESGHCCFIHYLYLPPHPRIVHMHSVCYDYSFSQLPQKI